MEALKKNGFAIALSAAGVVALVLLYMFVIGPAIGGGSLNDKKEALQAQLTKLNRYGDKRKVLELPTEAAKKNREDAEKKLKEAIGNVHQFYSARKEKFAEIPEGYTGDADSPAGFKAYYDSRIEDLTKEYRTKFAKAPPPAAAEAPSPGGTGPASPSAPAQPASTTPPAVPPPAVAPAPVPPARGGAADAQEEKIVDAMARIEKSEDIQRANKELWLVEEIFKAATDLKLGGIQAIRFPGRTQAMTARAEAAKKEAKKDSKRDSGKVGKDAAKAPARTFELINVQVTLDMPLNQFEPLLAKLFQSERALLRLESMDVRKKPEALQTKVLVVKDYPTDGEAAKESSDALLAEPPETIQFTLAAIDWLGAPEEATAQ